MLSLVLVVSIIGCTVAGPSVTRSRQDIESFEAFLANSRTDNGVRLESRMLMNPLASEWENSGKFQGDILLDDAQVQALLEQFAQGRNAYTWPDTIWPDNTVIWEFAPDVFDEAQKAAIIVGIEDIEKRTCIRFRLREPEDSNFVRVTGLSGGCYANVGYNGTRGVHTYNLALNTPGLGCFRHTTIVHEWLHILGFFHMQSTHDRDDYVRVLWENIREGTQNNFQKYSADLVDNLELPYEYDSVMHYGRYGFSINGEPTLLPLNEDNGLMGQREYITDIDFLRASRHHNCPGSWD